MADIVNLNRFRKAKQKAEDGRKAEENRVRFGRTKAQKDADRQEEERRARELAGKRMDEPDPQ